MRSALNFKSVCFLNITFDSETNAVDLSRGYGCTDKKKITRIRQYAFPYLPDLMTQQVGICEA